MFEGVKDPTPPHLRLLNPPFPHCAQDREGFPLFTWLPFELRRLVWRCALERNRFVLINISRIKGKNGYAISTSGLEVHHPLLHVNGESRSEALEFYRVRIPTRGVTSCVYCNPEFDFLNIDVADYDCKFLVDFLTDFRARDPRGVGVQNLALEQSAFHGM
jgi:hypothetical protein